MTATTIIKCDNCQHDLTETGSNPRYRLALISEEVPNRTGLTTLKYVVPLIRHPHHFCDTMCLKTWLDRGSKAHQSPATPHT
jgi:hypothetical protein